LPAERGGDRALRDLTVGGGEGDQGHPVEFMAGVAPGVGGGVLDHADEQQRQPAQLNVGTDAVLAVVEHRAKPERALHVSPAAFDVHQLLVGVGEVVGAQRLVRGAQQPLTHRERRVVKWPVGGASRCCAMRVERVSGGLPRLLGVMVRVEEVEYFGEDFDDGDLVEE